MPTSYVSKSTTDLTPMAAQKMAQQRLHRYFRPTKPVNSGPVRTARCSFLDLPTSVRGRIYRETGLVPPEGQSWGRMTMNTSSLVHRGCQFAEINLSGGDDPRDHTPRPDCHRCCGDENYHDDWCGCKSPFPSALFYVCRVISDETIQLFYSETRFDIAYTASGKLSALETLGPVAIASLQDLRIHMNVCFCSEGPECQLYEHRQGCHPACKIWGHDEQLDPHRKSRAASAMISDLDRVCQRIRLYLPSSQLRLSFLCEIKHSDSPGNSETDPDDLTSRLVASLQKLPTLRSCAVYFSRRSDPHLRATAEMLRQRLTTPPTASSRYFRLRDLPKELELNILRFTGLVAPRCVEYDKVHSIMGLGIRLFQGDTFADRPVSLPCCCRYYNRGSASGWNCEHWHFPSQLFLVDRQMENDARTIMYRENTWTIQGWRALLGAEGDQIAIPRVLKSIPGLLENVRRLSLCFHDIEDLGSEENDAWKGVINTLVNRCAVEMLALVILLPHPEHSWYDQTWGPAECVWREHNAAIHQIPAALGGRRLREFYLDISKMHVFDDQQHGKVDCPCRCPVATVYQQERRKEEVIIGPIEDWDSHQQRKASSIHRYHLDDYNWRCRICGDT